MAKVDQELALELAFKQQQPLDLKIKMSLDRIRDWYKHFGGNVAVSFSGGKDSTALLHLVRSVYPDVPAVFIDTGLEYPEIRQFVKETQNVLWIRPEMPFPAVVQQYGYPVISKRVSQYVHEVQQVRSITQTTVARVTGIRGSGAFSRKSKIPDKWLFLAGLDSSVVRDIVRGRLGVGAGVLPVPAYKISDRCCYKLKKGSVHKINMQMPPFTGEMACDSDPRETAYLSGGGCNQFGKKIPKSMPLSFWLEKDVWEYIRGFGLPYSPIYDMGYHRTGCMFCCFGIHLEQNPNRFQLMHDTHPKHYQYCMEKLGIRGLLDYINKHLPPRQRIQYAPTKERACFGLTGRTK